MDQPSVGAVTLIHSGDVLGYGTVVCASASQFFVLGNGVQLLSSRSPLKMSCDVVDLDSGAAAQPSLHGAALVHGAHMNLGALLLIDGAASVR